ncbi:hypothetical protein [Niabella hirudinis]|uniref:hypothetical protein n=1 Tax=Niabella hirudinis TaxID=1285929 RepID=UPI003EB7433A
MRKTNCHLRLVLLLYITAAALVPIHGQTRQLIKTNDAEKCLECICRQFSIAIGADQARNRRNTYEGVKKKILDNIANRSKKGPEADLLFIKEKTDFQNFLSNHIIKMKDASGMRIYLGTRWKENFYQPLPDQQNRWKLVFIFTPTKDKKDKKGPHPAADYSKNTFYIFDPNAEEPFETIKRKRAARYVRNFQKPHRTKKRLTLNGTLDPALRNKYGKETKHVFFNRDKVKQMIDYIDCIPASSLKMRLFTHLDQEPDTVRSRLGIDFIFANSDGSDYTTPKNATQFIEAIKAAIEGLRGKALDPLNTLLTNLQKENNPKKKQEFLAQMIKISVGNKALTDDAIVSFDTGSPTPPPKKGNMESLDAIN